MTNVLRFIETTAARMVRSMIEEAMADEWPTLIISAPGMGKSTALMHYSKELGGVYWEVRESESTVKQMFRCLLEACGFWHEGRHTNDIADALYRRLERDRSFSFLAIDEFQNLDLAALRELLRLCERRKVPLVLSGNDRRLHRVKSSDVALDQIKSRLGMRVAIPAPLAEDCRSIAVDYNVEGKGAYAALAAYGAQTSMRDLVKLLRVSVRVAEGIGSVQLHHIERACLGIHGDSKAIALLSAGEAAEK